MPQITAQYLGGHPDMSRVASGALRLDTDSDVMTFLEGDRGPNPVDLKVDYEERFVLPVSDLMGYRVGESDVLGGLAAAARGAMFLGVWGAANAIDHALDRVLVLAGAVSETPVRMSFMVHGGDVPPFLAGLDGRRSTLGLAGLADLAATELVSAQRGSEDGALGLIVQRLEEQGRLLAEILDRLPPRS